LNREQSLSSLYKALPIAEDIEGTRASLDINQFFTYIISLLVQAIFLLIVVFILFVLNGGKGSITDNFLQNYLISLGLSFILSKIPILRIPSRLLSNYIGRYTGQSELIQKIIDFERSFVKDSGLPLDLCNSKLLQKFIDYINTYKADNLKECHIVYERELQHQESLEKYQKLEREIRDIQSRLR